MPKIMSRYGPYRVTMAAGAALSLIEAEGVTIFRYDPSQGLDDELDFEVEILLPSGRSYPQIRDGQAEREFRPPKKHDLTCRIRFIADVPSGLAARNHDERSRALEMLRNQLRSHFESRGAHNVGFHKQRDDRTGRSAQAIVGFVNHPQETSRSEFIVTAFNGVKYVNAGMGELVKLKLDKKDTVLAKVQQCCFQTECPALRGGRCNMWKTMMQRHSLFAPMSSQPSGSRDGKRKHDGPSSEQMEQRKTAREEIKSKLAERRTGYQCRSHLKGRCTNGANCPTPHTTESATITCNSMITNEDAGVSRGNKTYGYCHLFNAKMECPYKDCVHGMTLAPEADQAEGGGEGDEDMSLV